MSFDIFSVRKSFFEGGGLYLGPFQESTNRLLLQLTLGLPLLQSFVQIVSADFTPTPVNRQLCVVTWRYTLSLSSRDLSRASAISNCL